MATIRARAEEERDENDETHGGAA